MLTVSSTVGNGAGVRLAYQALLGRIVAEREGEYFKTFGVLPDDANDPDGARDRRARTIVSAVADGFSVGTAHLSVKLMVATITNGVATLTMNPVYGLVSAYRASVSRAVLGLKRNLSDRKSGRRKKRPVKKSTKWRRLWLET